MKAINLAFLLTVISVRGGFKLGKIMIIISLFTALLVSLSISQATYVLQTSSLKEFIKPPNISVSFDKDGSMLNIKIAFLNVSGKETMIVLPSNLTRFLQLHKVSVKGKLPGEKEVLVSEKLKHLYKHSISILGKNYNVSGYIYAKGFPSNAIILPLNALDGLSVVKFSTLYYKKGSDFKIASQAPSIKQVIHSVEKEISRLNSTLTLLLLVALSFAVFFQAYKVFHEAKRTLTIFKINEAPISDMIISILILSLLLSIAGVSLGYFLGFFATGITSSLISLILRLPHLKPIAELSISYYLIVAFLTTYTSLTSALTISYIKIASSKDT